MALLCRYADFAGSTINDGFDYTYGKDLWKEKLAYTQSWLSAHISDADAIGKPLIVEEFGKAVSAKKVYTGELPHSLQAGEPPYKAMCLASWLWMLLATQVVATQYPNIITHVPLPLSTAEGCRARASPD